MKKLFYLSLCLPLMVACIGNGNTDGGNESDTDSIAPLCDGEVSVRGIVGEGTSMHELELIVTEDSTCYFSYDNDAVGGLAAGDEVYVSWFKSDDSRVYITNITSLSHLWQLDGADDKQCLQLDKNNSATTYGMDSTYDHWDLTFNLLRLYNHDVVSSEWNIQLLTSDSLIIDDGNGITWKMKRIN